MTAIEKHQWIARFLVVLAVVLALTAGLLQERLRIQTVQYKKLQNTVK